ncbi:hypothetical protein TEA_028489 [Camellia sinensis var. sinensis]|uniref:TF-B3 domain-containing protein n=1 Tax=Camellia sinensis var. sinensis TaxID=542762 RepID=A0A4S4ER63_CAMSN|nr:hypothetical protein TEA_028489 [Camellia sinensis var. sinensis]
MGEECRNCRKWEEDMYWTHFQSILFCQFLSTGFDQQLAIPQKFANNLKEKLPENVTLKGPSGAKWNVGLITSGDTLFFKHGWKTFVENHSLEEDDVLIFKYNGDSGFDVLIFDGRSLCEREASYFVRKCGHTELDGGCRTKKNMRESSVEVMHDSSHYVVDRTPSKRLRKDDNLMPVLSRFRGRTRKGDNSSRPHHSKWDMRSREPSTSAVGPKSIPSEWATSHLPRKSQEVILRVKENICVKENTWHARFYYRVYGGGLTGGWRNFAVENNLEEFDVCLFELASGTNDTISMNVSIYRVIEEIRPLTRMTPPSSTRGKNSKYLRRKRN